MNKCKLLLAVFAFGCVAQNGLGETVSAAKPDPGFASPVYHARPSAIVGQPSGLFPDAVRRFYGFDKVNYFGAGQTIAIVDAFDNPNVETDLLVFTQRFGLSPCTTQNGCFKKVYAAGTPPPVNTGWGLEIALDVEWAHSIAPSAKILLVEAATNSYVDLFNAVGVAVAQGANVVSMSFGGSEIPIESVLFDPTFNVPNVSFVAASGDSGQGVFYPAASPYVLSVGGTTLETDSTGARIGEIGWSGSSGGQSKYEPQPPPQLNFGVAGGQTSRNVPDVAYQADSETGVPVYFTYFINGQIFGGWFQVGGTSAGAPQWSALIAVINGARVGAGKNVLAASYTYGTLDAFYSLALAQYNQAYYDVTRGINGLCGNFCIAGKGYDLVTGLGSPKVKDLVPALVSAP